MQSSEPASKGHWLPGRSLAPALAALVTAAAFLPLSVPAKTPPELSNKVMQMERDRGTEFESFFGEDLADVSKGPDQIAAELSGLSTKSGQNSALLYAIPRQDHLHLVLIFPAAHRS